MKKSISWFSLWKRIGKQPLRETRGKKVEFHMNGIKYECALIYTDNGSKWHLEPIKMVEENLTCFDCKYHFMSDCYLECHVKNRINNDNICDNFQRLNDSN